MDAVEVLLQNGGGAAAVLVLLGGYCVRLHKQLNDLQEKRITDAQQLGTKMLDVAKETSAQRERMVEVLTLNTQALNESREQLEELTQHQRHRRPPL